MRGRTRALLAMANLEEIEAEIKAIASVINDMKASGAAKADPDALKKHVVRSKIFV